MSFAANNLLVGGPRPGRLNPKPRRLRWSMDGVTRGSRPGAVGVCRLNGRTCHIATPQHVSHPFADGWKDNLANRGSGHRPVCMNGCVSKGKSNHHPTHVADRDESSGFS